MLTEKLKESKPGINELVTVNFTLAELRSLLALITAAQEMQQEIGEGDKVLTTAVIDGDVYSRFISALEALEANHDQRRNERA